jgi:hypothetical protein
LENQSLIDSFLNGDAPELWHKKYFGEQEKPCEHCYEPIPCNMECEQKQMTMEQVREAFEPIQLGESSVVNQAMDLASKKCGKREQEKQTASQSQSPAIHVDYEGLCNNLNTYMAKNKMTVDFLKELFKGYVDQSQSPVLPSDSDIENASLDYVQEMSFAELATMSARSAYKQGAFDMRDRQIYISPKDDTTHPLIPSPPQQMNEAMKYNNIIGFDVLKRNADIAAKDTIDAVKESQLKQGLDNVKDK